MVTCAVEPKVTADPTTVVPYSLDWSDWLTEGDTIVDSSWSVLPSGFTILTDVFDPTSTTVWGTGGDVGQGYRLTNHITTDDGMEDEFSIKVIIIDK